MNGRGCGRLDDRVVAKRILGEFGCMGLMVATLRICMSQYS